MPRCFRRKVSTHSRPKAAGTSISFPRSSVMFQHTAARRRLGQSGNFSSDRHSFNTQPPEGGWTSASTPTERRCCFNTQPPEGGWLDVPILLLAQLSRFNTQPPEGGWIIAYGFICYIKTFQHTAARRRLADDQEPFLSKSLVSTHSRPKAAGLLENF